MCEVRVGGFKGAGLWNEVWASSLHFTKSIAVRARSTLYS